MLKSVAVAGVLKGFLSAVLAHVRMAVSPGETQFSDIPKTGVGNHCETRLKWCPIRVNSGFPESTGNRLPFRSSAKVAAMPSRGALGAAPLPRLKWAKWCSSPTFPPGKSSRHPVKRRRCETQFPVFENMTSTGDMEVIPALEKRLQEALESL